MENVKLVFSGSELSKTDDKELWCFCNNSDEISILIDSEVGLPTFIVLNKATAVRLSKELKKQIGFIGTPETNQ